MAAAAAGCHDGNIDNGFVILSTCNLDSSAYMAYCTYHCNPGYVRSSSGRVMCIGNDTWQSTNPRERTLCVPDDRTTPLPKETTPRETVKPLPPMLTQPPTNRPSWNEPRTTEAHNGYYKDPHMEMNVSPVIFVGAVVGGIVAVVLVVFTIFFRAHKKMRRDARERTFLSNETNIVNQPDSTDPNGMADEAAFREIAQRIISNANQNRTDNQRSGDSQLSPPPYERLPPTNNPDRSAGQGQFADRSPPYTAGQPLFVNLPPNSPHSHDVRRQQENKPEVVDGRPDAPPPYEYVKPRDQMIRESSCYPYTKRDPNLPAPPPYSDC